ncbi:MAG: hypothetical protein QOD36_3187 [Mycobacterium sp.]|jgi:uncharacterized membrane protein|nr:hypothetical protein [Mycobacterium sp.]
MNSAVLFLTVFLACAVEAVEATTVVLAMGTARDWRSALSGVAAGLLLLAAAVAVLGPAISAVPLDDLRLLVGGVLLIFGLQWLRKAVLRASGHKALHDEDALFRQQLAAAQSAAGGRRGLVPDGYGFTVSFKSVVLEGLEVVFIVLTFGSNAHDVPVAAVAALIAVVVVAGAGIAVRAPLSRVPENTMKFVVGVLLCAFGTFWGAEGAGASWPGSDAAILVLVLLYAGVGLLLAAALRDRSKAPS